MVGYSSHFPEAPRGPRTGCRNTPCWEYKQMHWLTAWDLESERPDLWSLQSLALIYSFNFTHCFPTRATTAPKGMCGHNWKHFPLSQLVGCYSYLVSKRQGSCWICYNAQESSPQPRITLTNMSLLPELKIPTFKKWLNHSELQFLHLWLRSSNAHLVGILW